MSTKQVNIKKLQAVFKSAYTEAQSAEAEAQAKLEGQKDYKFESVINALHKGNALPASVIIDRDTAKSIVSGVSKKEMSDSERSKFVTVVYGHHIYSEAKAQVESWHKDGKIKFMTNNDRKAKTKRDYIFSVIRKVMATDAKKMPADSKGMKKLLTEVKPKTPAPKPFSDRENAMRKKALRTLRDLVTMNEGKATKKNGKKATEVHYALNNKDAEAIIALVNDELLPRWQLKGVTSMPKTRQAIANWKV